MHKYDAFLIVCKYVEQFLLYFRYNRVYLHEIKPLFLLHEASPFTDLFGSRPRACDSWYLS